MRIGPPLLALAALSGSSIAGEREGKIIRVERAPSREVFIAAGSFMMGIEEETADVAENQCETYFQTHIDLQGTPVLPTSSGPTTFCNRYREEMGQMTERPVYLSAFAIDRDEASVADYRKCVKTGTCSLDPL